VTIIIKQFVKKKDVRKIFIYYTYCCRYGSEQEIWNAQNESCTENSNC